MKKIEQHQIFDNAFLSGCAWHKRLMIPLVNEIFGKDIPLDAYIERSANEQFKHGKNSKNEDVLIKRITDSLVKVGNRYYHLECESKNDGQILIRIGDYDMQIAMSDAIYDNLTDAYGKARITKIEYENIITLCIDVVSEITKDVKFRERLVNIMGNEVLLTAEERGLDKGLKALVNSLKKHCDNFQSLYKEVISNEEYRHCSEEQVKKYYN